MASEDWREVLINEVRKRKCLWDKTDRAYKDSRTTKANNWTDVAAAMSATTSNHWTGK